MKKILIKDLNGKWAVICGINKKENKFALSNLIDNGLDFTDEEFEQLKKDYPNRVFSQRKI